MKQIGAEIGVNESRVSQLHARAIRRLREALGEMGPAADGRDAPGARGVHAQKPSDGKGPPNTKTAAQGVVLAVQAGREAPAARVRAGGALKVAVAASARPAVARRALAAADSPSRTALSRSASRNGLASQRQPLILQEPSASVPATSPVTKITRLASAGYGLHERRDRTPGRRAAASSDRRSPDRTAAA